MNLDSLAVIALILAAIPCSLFLLNLLVYRPTPRSSRREEAHSESAKCEVRSAELKSELPPAGGHGVSVLIPARNEEANIRDTLGAVLANRGSDFEVIILDDHSTDDTAEIVSEFARRDARIRLEFAPPLPAGWCGKQHACHVLAKLARHPLLVFIDADVRLASEALTAELSPQPRTVDSHVTRLRKKLGPEGAVIRTVWGVGYRFDRAAGGEAD